MTENVNKVRSWAEVKWKTLIDVKAHNDEDVRLGRLFNTLMVISTAIVILLVIVFLMMIPLGLSNYTTIYLAAVFPLVFIPLSIYCILSAKHGHLKSSINIYVWTNFAAISGAVWLFDGIYSPAWLLYIWTITIAGTLLTPVYSLWMTSGVVLHYALLLFFYKLGLYKPPLTFGEAGREYATIASLLIMFMSTVGLLTYLNMKSLQKALNDLHNEIAEHKQTESELNESNEKYRTVADFTYDWEYWVGPDGKYIYISPSCERITGYKPDAFINDPELLTSIIHTHDRPTFVNHLSEVMQDDCDVRRIDFRIITRSGEIRWISHTCCSVSSSAGKWLGRRGSNSDITERKKIEEVLRKSEDKFRSIAETISDWIWEVDSEGKYIYTNPRSKDILGYEPAEIIGKTPFDFMPPEEAEHHRKIFNDAVKTPHSLRVIENINFNKNGSIVILETNAIPILDAEGNCTGYRGIDRDITERKLAEQKIQKINEELKELNATKDTFFSIIAHDLKSPFQGLLGYSQILSTEYSTLNEEEKLFFIQSIYDLSKSAFTLLENLLIWSRIQTGKIVFNPDVFNLQEEIMPTVEMLMQVASNKNILVECQIHGKTLVQADKNMIQTVVRNLVSNAIKFTNPDGKVIISSRQNGKFIEVSVEDTGVGIRRENLDKIFKSGAVVSTKGTANEEGTGLGLILCTEMIKMHGGKIWAESKLGKGSKFIFQIPSIM